MNRRNPHLHNSVIPPTSQLVVRSRCDPEDVLVLSRLGFPAIGRHRLFVTAIGIDALGSGVWMPLSVLYFVRVTHLSLVQVGVALSVAAALSFPLALVIGSLVDRYDAKRVLQGGNVLQAIGFAAYPLAHSVLAVTLVVAIAALGRTAFWGSYSPMVAAVSEAGEREKWFGFLGALRNSGFAVGGLLAAAAITIGTHEAFHAVVLLNAASYVLAFVLMVRVEVHGVHRDGVRQRQGGGWSEVARDPGYRWLVGANFGYAMGCLALNVVMPVYIVQMLGLPGWVSGAVYVINTVLIGVGQGLIVRQMTGSVRWRIVVLAAGLMIVAFLLLYARRRPAPRRRRSRWCWGRRWSTRSARWPADRCSRPSPPSHPRPTCGAATSRSTSSPGTPRPPSRRCSTSPCSDHGTRSRPGRSCPRWRSSARPAASRCGG